MPLAAEPGKVHLPLKASSAGTIEALLAFFVALDLAFGFSGPVARWRRSRLLRCSSFSPDRVCGRHIDHSTRGETQVKSVCDYPECPSSQTGDNGNWRAGPFFNEATKRSVVVRLQRAKDWTQKISIYVRSRAIV